MSGILEGKRILITGVLMESSIAFHAAKLAQEQGAEIILTAFPRPTLTERIAKKLPKPVKVLELDVTNQEHLDGLAEKVRAELGGLDGVVHSIGFAPQDALGGVFLDTPWESVGTAMHVSAYSLNEENQARRLLNDLDEFRVRVSRLGDDEEMAAHEWLTRVFEPVVKAIPWDLRAKLEPAELFHEVLEHRWYMSQARGRAVPLAEVLTSYVDDVLRHRRDEATLMAPQTETVSLPVITSEIPEIVEDDGVDWRDLV